MSAIRITCPACARSLEVNAEPGEEVECGACLEVFVAKPIEKPVSKSSSESKPPLARVDKSTRSSPRKRRRDDHEDHDDEPDYDDEDYDPRPRRRDFNRGYREQKSRVAYILLALFLGSWGVHNFYAGRIGPGIAQLLITAISIPLMCVFFVGFFTIWIPIVWSIIDIIAVDRDANNVPMS
jgi:TM2 domain-containing membrane protein YozV